MPKKIVQSERAIFPFLVQGLGGVDLFELWLLRCEKEYIYKERLKFILRKGGQGERWGMGQRERDRNDREKTGSQRNKRNKSGFFDWL